MVVRVAPGVIRLFQAVQQAGLDALDAHTVDGAFRNTLIEYSGVVVVVRVAAVAVPLLLHRMSVCCCLVLRRCSAIYYFRSTRGWPSQHPTPNPSRSQEETALRTVSESPSRADAKKEIWKLGGRPGNMEFTLDNCILNS